MPIRRNRRTLKRDNLECISIMSIGVLLNISLPRNIAEIG
jgi:hypothetical protein